MTLALLITAVTGAWADNAVPYTVGATNNSGDFRSQNSNTLAIKDGQVATFEFTNYTSGVEAFHNWICEIDNAANQDQALIRADLWENVAKSRDNYTYYNYWDMIANNDAATFKAKMQGAKVRLLAIYYNGKITIEAWMTPTEGDPLVMVYEKAYTETQAKILLTIERCHLDITKEEVRYYVPLTATENKTDEWTINKMPAGNVDLDVIYYPQAAFAMSTDATPVALAPKASTSARANTDDSLVEGGTVAGIVDDEALLEEGQGTLLYHFSATQLDAAALEALTATDWTEKVPTADGLAEGTVYVYYYIKGADDLPGITPGAKFTFSDSDIQELAVTVLPEPTYTVEFAEGTPETDKWTISPAKGLNGGETVTATYSGDKKVKSVKAVKKGGAVDPAKAYLKWDADQKKLVETAIPAEVTTVQNADQNVTWAAGTYVVEGNVTINGGIILNGNVELIIKDGAKLTANQIYDNGSSYYNLSIYGQASQTGQLVVNCSDHAISGIDKLEVHSCKVKATSTLNRGGGFYRILTFNVYGGSVDAENTAGEGYGINLYDVSPMNIFGGEVKAIGKGNGDKSYGIMCASSKNSATVTVYGGKLWAENADNKALNSTITLTKDAGFTGKIETSDNGTSWTEYTDDATPTTKYVRVGY